MEKHLETDTKEHLALVHEKLLRQQKCLEAQNESIQLQKEHIKLQRDALSTYKKDLVELRTKFADGELIWKISQFNQKMKDAKTQRSPELLVSEPFYTHKNGYKMCAGLWVNGFGSGKGKYISVGLQVKYEIAYDIFMIVFERLNVPKKIERCQDVDASVSSRAFHV